jgi:hypothetical protein
LPRYAKGRARIRAEAKAAISSYQAAHALPSRNPKIHEELMRLGFQQIVNGWPVDYIPEQALRNELFAIRRIAVSLSQSLVGDR